MRTWALYSLKGGVGKTAAAVNLAWEAAGAGRRVLVWDLDPQGAATWYLRVETDDRLAAKKVVAGKVPLGRHVRPTRYARLDVLPADFSFRHADALLRAASGAKKVLRRLIEPFSEQYHLMILDCPPGIGTLAAGILRAADTVPVPVVPTPLSLRALRQIRDFAAAEGVPDANLRPFYSLVDRRKRLHRDLLEAPPKLMRGAPDAWIGYSAEAERMGEARAPLGAYAPRSPVAAQFHRLWRALDEGG